MAREIERKRAQMKPAGVTMHSRKLEDEINFLEREILNFVRNAAAAPPQGTPAPEQFPNEKEMFEAWVKRTGPAFDLCAADPECGTFAARDTEDMWIAWLACLEAHE